MLMCPVLKNLFFKIPYTIQVKSIFFCACGLSVAGFMSAIKTESKPNNMFHICNVLQVMEKRRPRQTDQFRYLCKIKFCSMPNVDKPR